MMDHMAKQEQQSPTLKTSKLPIWDCDSALYDSFELNSFKLQLDAAIAATTRSLSLPRLSAPPPTKVVKKHSKVVRSLKKLLRSVFRRKTLFAPPPFEGGWRLDPGFYSDCSEPSSLSTIPEVRKEAFGSPALFDDDAVVRKTASERFTRATGRLGGGGLI